MLDVDEEESSYEEKGMVLDEKSNELYEQNLKYKMRDAASKTEPA